MTLMTCTWRSCKKKTVPKRTGSRYFFPANGPWWTWLAWKMSVMASGGHKILEAILKSNLANLEVEENHLRRWGLRIDRETLWGNISRKHVFCEADLSADPASGRERRNEKEVQTKQQGWLKWVWFQHILSIHVAVGDYLAPNLVKIYRWYVGRLYCLSMFVLYQQKKHLISYLQNIPTPTNKKKHDSKIIYIFSFHYRLRTFSIWFHFLSIHYIILNLVFFAFFPPIFVVFFFPRLKPPVTPS